MEDHFHPMDMVHPIQVDPFFDDDDDNKIKNFTQNINRSTNLITFIAFFTDTFFTWFALMIFTNF